VANLCCVALHNIALNNRDSGKEDSCLANYLKNIISALLKATQRTDLENSDLVNSAYHAITIFIAHSSEASRAPMKALCENFIRRLRETFSNSGSNNQDFELRLQQQGHICAVLLVLVQKLDEDIKPFAQEMIRLYVQIFRSQKGSAYVHEDALMAVGSVANALGETFLPYVDEVMPYVKKGINAVQQHAVCTASVGALSDIARAIGPHLIDFNTDEIMTALIDAVKKPALHRSVKPHILAAFGDIAWALGVRFKKYFKSVMEVIEWAAKTSKRPDDDEWNEYIDQLREGILDGYTGILQGLWDGDIGSIFEPYIPNLMNFLELIFSDPDRTDNTIEAMVGVLGDLAKTVGGPARTVLGSGFTKKVVTSGLRHSEPEIVKMAEWAQEQITPVLRGGR
jgi:importin subunit beta-1